MDTVRGYAERHAVSVVAAGLVVALPGTYHLVTGKSLTCAIGLCEGASSHFSSSVTSMIQTLSAPDLQHLLDVRLSLPMSKWNDEPVSAYMFRLLESSGKVTVDYLLTIGDRLGIDSEFVFDKLADRWASEFPFSRLVSVAVSTALPGAFLVFARNHPDSWAGRHQARIANALHVLVLVSAANQKLWIQDLLVTALVMVSFETWQRTLNHGTGIQPSAVETLLSQAHSVVAESDIVAPPKSHDDVGAISTTTTANPKEEIVRLRAAVTELQTNIRVQEHDLKRSRDDLRDARERLSSTFTEYASVRDELKAVKQATGRDHQAIIYRKDIELFALRKANEQKETYAKERDIKTEEIARQHATALELKEAQIDNLKKRVAFLERQDSPNDGSQVENSVDGEAALQVKLLRVKGRNSQEVDRFEEEKEAEVARLNGELAAAKRALEARSPSTSEIQRAWEATDEVQHALQEEKKMHAQTQTRLEEVALRLEEELRKISQKNSPTRLPTIEEQDQKELEAMFNSAQQDNLRLYKEVEALDKRVREANAKVFTSEQKTEALREQLKLEKAVNEDMETARPSLVHRVHFQRMEGQLKQSRDELSAKEDQLEQLHKQAGERDNQIKYLEKEKKLAVAARNQLREENDRLKQSVAELDSTKQQLMLDHERLASQRARQRPVSTEYTSARSSGTTLITDPNINIIPGSEEPMPARPVSIAAGGSVQSTPERHVGNDANRVSLITNNAPPPELRSTRRRSLILKGLMRKMTGKDDGEGERKPSKPIKTSESQNSGSKADAKVVKPLAPKDANSLLRPKTSAAAESAESKNVEDGKTTASDLTKRPKTATALRMGKGDKKTPAATRYDPNDKGSNDARPKTAALLNQSKGGDAVRTKGADTDATSPRSKSRGWSTSRKFRKSAA